MSKGNKGGRPTEYREEFIDKVDEYLKTCVETERIFEKTTGAKSTTYERIPYVNVPKIEGFAAYIDVSKSSIYEWIDLYPEFSHAIDKIRLAQHNFILDGAVAGRFNPVVSKLILSTNHGYRDKADTDLTTGGDKIIIMPQELINKNQKKTDEPA